MGKTTFALNIALNTAVKAKTSVAFFSLEMSKEQIVDKLICSQAMVDGWKLRTGNLSEDDFPAIGMAMGTLAEAPIFVDDTPMLSPLEIRTRARRLKAEGNLGLIIIDYLQMLDSGMHRSGGNESNRVQEVSDISRALKAIARELDVPVIALSQLNRGVESRDKKIPQLSDLRDSGSIEQDADVVIFMYREDYYEKDTERKGITDILIRKHRNGPTGELELHFRAEQSRFMDIDRKAKSSTAA
jgi:replicative DNA helicase